MPAMTESVMPITVKVQPDLSAFYPPTAEELAAAVGCDEATALAVLDNFFVLPKAKSEEEDVE
jgi:hypothetical protein